MHHAAQTAAMDAVVALLQVEYVTKKIGVRGVQRNEVLTSLFRSRFKFSQVTYIQSFYICGIPCGCWRKDSSAGKLDLKGNIKFACQLVISY